MGIGELQVAEKHNKIERQREMQTWIIPLVINVPIIRRFEFRKQWQFLNQDAVTVAIYNTGRHLFMDPFYKPATTHYDYVWCWMRYRNFCESKYVLASKRFSIKKPTQKDVFKFRHLGHDVFGIAHVRLGNGRGAGRGELEIPPQHILYLAVKNGIIVSRMLIQQPLPFRLLPLNFGQIFPIEVKGC